MRIFLSLAKALLIALSLSAPLAVSASGTTSSNVVSYTPSNPKDLIIWCLDMAKMARAPLLPMQNPIYPVTFSPGDPDLIGFVQQGLDSKKWLRQTVIDPGNSVASASISTSTMSAIANQVYASISSWLTSQQAYWNLVNSLLQKQLTVQKFAKNLFDGINKILTPPADDSEAISAIFDQIVMQNLPSAQQTVLKQASVLFALTNWGVGGTSVYLDVFFNPRLGDLDFGFANSDKTGLQILNANDWVDHKMWSINMGSGS